MATIYKAEEKQELFHLSQAEEVLYGGAAGGGKSFAIIWDAVMKAMQYKQARIAIFRRKFPELEKSIILDFLEYVPASWYEYNKKDHRATFHQTGSLIEFNHCQLESDVYNYQSAQYDFIFFDELTHFTEYIYTYLQSRCRSPKGYPAQVKCASNPGNIGHHWVKTRFIDGYEPYTIETHSEELPNGKLSEYTTEYIPARVYDNKYIMEKDPKYISRLQKIPNESERKALLDGDWDSFEGQFFKEWNYDQHTIKPFKIPPDWQKIRTVDWGYTAPTVCLWIAFSPAKVAFVYREMTITEATIEETVEMIKHLSGDETYSYTTADPSLWSTTQYERGESIAHRITYMGVPLMKADNNRIAGWNVIHSYMDFDEKTDARLKIFTNCLQTIKTIPGLIHDSRKPEDLDSDGDDHHADALRYGLMTRPLSFYKPKVQHIPQFSFEAMMKQKEDRNKQRGYVGSF